MIVMSEKSNRLREQRRERIERELGGGNLRNERLPKKRNQTLSQGNMNRGPRRGQGSLQKARKVHYLNNSRTICIMGGEREKWGAIRKKAETRPIWWKGDPGSEA